LAATVIIPARYASTRFPAKILANATGRPLVQHVVDQVRKCKRVNQVIVATDDQRIVEALRPLDTDVRMTATTHQSGTDRVWEVAQRFASGSIIVNVQGDEPEIEPETVDRLIEVMQESYLTPPHYGMATAATPFPAGADPMDPNLVKVVIGQDNQALYFSRAPIPYSRDKESAGNVAYHLHLGIYAYTWDFLREYVSQKPTPLEQTEKLEQLRALEHGRSIYVLKVDRATHGIDTTDQYESFVRRFNSALRTQHSGL
jgi:3-deoxy-manno-octulosonate cytidylyltransferase (CMP-KDO synthetase)